MARGRLIDKEIHRDTDLGELPVGARYLYKGMIIHADDDGRMKAGSRYLMATIFPYDPPIDAAGLLLATNVRDWRNALAALGIITLYEKDGKKYLAHKNWTRWQLLRKDRCRPSDCPAPTDDGCHLVAIGLTSGCHPGTEVNLTEVNRTEPKSKSHWPKAEKTPPDSRIAALIKDFFTRLQTKLGEKPKAFNGGAAGRIFTALLKDYHPEQIVERMQSWFDSSDPFIVKNGWRIEMFNMNFNTLKGGPIHAQSNRPGGGYIGAAPVAGKYAALSNRPKHS